MGDDQDFMQSTAYLLPMQSNEHHMSQVVWASWGPAADPLLARESGYGGQSLVSRGDLSLHPTRSPMILLHMK